LRAVLAFALYAVAASPALAQTEVRLSPITVEGQLQPKASPAGAVRFYPDHAEQAHIDGDVLLRCQARPQGGFDACEVMEESPRGEDFGRRAQEIAGRLNITVPGADGKPFQGGVALLPLRFRMAQPPVR
jgi:protein TonB